MGSLQISSTSSICLPKSSNLDGDDSILSPKRIGNGYLLAVADGVGKYEGAKIASQEAINYLESLKLKDEKIDFKLIFSEIKIKLEEMARKSPELAQMATTLTACYITENKIIIGHTGDSRAYIMLNKKLKKLTTDQTEHEMLLSSGVFTEKQLRNHPRKNVLLYALSPRIDLKTEVIEIDFCQNPLYLMSDGAYHFWEKNPKFSDSTMNSVSSFCSSLEKRIKHKGPKDDFSVVGIQFRKLHVN